MKISTLVEYESEVLRTVNFTLGANEFAVLALGVAGEAGEVCDLLKKHYGQGHELNKDKIIEEIGDCYWYLTALAARMGYSLSEVLSRNSDKLRKRYEKGFTVDESVNRG